ncbi:CDF family Co(II)/Ni(II) efflux transporter DmeF [Methylomonas sp. MED-D]|uniref:CDF family Co(II)/Ni(II) efflux transporter DmeF n=1 Tax=unclassified Methylomonas TaxID=2608980 RepID=UPI00143BC703|nr:CDF family Co(II)/Ni(II) efflux transporter DmeF [Methylomonas sp. MV1]MDT4331842.1 CDF family Co(II)/Ni(II) efflux transporter DmeF [Methylomonas sp. MV1]NJA06908.1 CDF family Co(II)/Ni(II) efflux transporter DmeF [Methylococcaceae bacterium WWC4]
MHVHQLSRWEHPHNFARINRKGERRTKWVLLLTFTTMLVEIGAGMQFHSIALQADGWHMATHVVAFMITIFAYRYTRLHQFDNTFAFSPAKVGVLGGFASSIALAMVALAMTAESVERLMMPQTIRFDEAIIVAAVGLGINLLSALLLRDHHDHHHGHAEHGHDHRHHDHDDHDHSHSHDHHQDHNLRAAYLHVMADALTSVLAMVALLAGKYYGWVWLDAAMGFVGALVILIWSYGLVGETAPVLLDQSMATGFLDSIRGELEADGETKVSDLHVWRLSANHCAAIVGVVTQFPQSPAYYKTRLAGFSQLDHVTVEVNRCNGRDCDAE